MSRRSSRVGKLILVVSGVLLAFALIEVALRISISPDELKVTFNTASPADSARWVQHPFLPFAGRPNADYTFHNQRDSSTEHIQTNSYGFRSHEFPTVKGPKDYFIVCLGESTTYGEAASNDLTWPEVLERKLQQHYPDRHIEVFNMGTDMATSVVSVVNLALIGTHLRPDLVIAYHGYNDAASIGTQNFRTDHSHFYTNLDPSKVWRGIERSLPRWALSSYAIAYAAGASDLVFRLNDLGNVVTQPRTDDPDRFKGMEANLRNLDTLSSIAKGRGGTALFSTFQFTDGNNPFNREFNERLRRFFQQKGFEYVDQDALIPDYDDSINTDECHFTQKGREMMAENFFQYIVREQLLDRSTGLARPTTPVVTEFAPAS